MIRKMVRDLNFPVQIVVCPIVRESDGLAMSYATPISIRSSANRRWFSHAR